jgi:hypothetical protein
MAAGFSVEFGFALSAAEPVDFVILIFKQRGKPCHVIPSLLMEGGNLHECQIRNDTINIIQSYLHRELSCPLVFNA